MDSHRLFERFRHQAEHNFIVRSSRASIGRAAYEREKEVAFLENERAAGEIPSLFCYLKFLMSGGCRCLIFVICGES